MGNFEIQSLVTEKNSNLIIADNYPISMKNFSRCTKIYGKFKCYINQTEFFEYNIKNVKDLTKEDLKNEFEKFCQDIEEEKLLSIFNVIKSGKLEKTQENFNFGDQSEEAQLARSVFRSIGGNCTSKEFKEEAMNQTLEKGLSLEALNRCVAYYA